MSTNWTMPRRTEACCACQRPFDPGEEFCAYLYETSAGYERHDYCLNCGVPITPVPIGSWRTRRPMPRSSSVPTFDREAVYRFFERLEGSDEPQRIQFRFLLALLLWRKKVIKLERTMTLNDTEIWEFRTPSTGTTHRVQRPELDEDRLEELSNQIAGLLTGEPVTLDVPIPDLATEADSDA